MRAGEICHLRESWFDWDRGLLDIPRHQPCEKGRHGDACGYCRHQARQSVEKTGVDYEKAIGRMWSPKTPTAARAVPFDFSERVRETLEEYFFFNDALEISRSAINRRVDRVLEAAGLPTDTAYPHSLRATAASYHAYKGLPAPALQSLMGWKKLSVATKYIRLSGGATQDSLRDVHSDD